MSDGFDASSSPNGRVSWTDGTVELLGLATNDRYLVQVFELE